MLRQALCFAALCVTAFAQSTNSTTGVTLSSTASATSTFVPRGTPVPGNYAGSLRPRVHFSPPMGFKNDPNGLFVYNGTYHYYYQYNPTATVAGNQHWGHATSTDGYTWINQPIAIFPPGNETYIFSGSAVVDSNNTSGFFPDQNNGVVAIYTLASYFGGTQGLQTQALAYSRDGGYTFTPYENNPVLDEDSTNFRDPKVIWHAPTSRWVMVVAFAADFVISIYTSPNLIDWTFGSNFTHSGLLGIQYECPNMVAVPFVPTTNTSISAYSSTASTRNDSYIMYLSINPGAPLGGSIGQYFPGTFNGTHFTADDAAARISDFGKDNYAGQFFYSTPSDPGSTSSFSSPSSPALSIDWASNWQYTQIVPTGPLEGWRSIATVPRSTYLTSLPNLGTILVRYPYNIASIFDQPLYTNASLGNDTVSLSYADLASKALWFEANVTGLTPTTLRGSVNMTFSSSISGESIRLGTNIGNEIWLSRRGTVETSGLGDNPFFTDAFSASGVYGQQGTWTVAGVVDRSVVEVFLNGGQQVGTMVFYPQRELDTLTVGVAGVAEGVGVSVAVWGLRDTWAVQVDGGGVVRGNSSTGGLRVRDEL
ncbi:Glycosyl hydrolases family 32 N-terminal domain-containing protein 2 [Elsinoe fawcettii]|nr:Glycosyl hydrolases family 32 N-terminal domain-containing protein 2 [Elsinoe fawcettii]